MSIWKIFSLIAITIGALSIFSCNKEMEKEKEDITPVIESPMIETTITTGALNECNNAIKFTLCGNLQYIDEHGEYGIKLYKNYKVNSENTDVSTFLTLDSQDEKCRNYSLLTKAIADNFINKQYDFIPYYQENGNITYYEGLSVFDKPINHIINIPLRCRDNSFYQGPIVDKRSNGICGYNLSIEFCNKKTGACFESFKDPNFWNINRSDPIDMYLVLSPKNDGMNSYFLFDSLPEKVHLPDFIKEEYETPLKPSIFPVCTNVGNEIFIFGGRTSRQSYTRESYKLNINTLQWTKLNPMNGEISLATSIPHDSSIYVIAGYSGHEPDSLIHRYDIKKDSMFIHDTFPLEGGYGVTLEVNGRIFSGLNEVSDRWFELDLDNDTIIPRAKFPIEILNKQKIGFVWNDKIYVKIDFIAGDNFYEYDMDNDSWNKQKSAIQNDITTAHFISGTKIIFFAPGFGRNIMYEHDGYNLWSQLCTLEKFALYDNKSVQVGDKLYVFHGNTTNSQSWEYPSKDFIASNKLLIISN